MNEALSAPNAIRPLLSSSHPGLLTLLRSCRNMRELKQIHAQIILKSDNLSPHQTSAHISKLVSASSSHGHLDYAANILQHQHNPSVPNYNVLIRGLCSDKTQTPLRALALYKKLLLRGLRPNNFTFPFLIKACTESAPVTRTGTAVHAQVVKVGLEVDSYVRSSLIHLYANWKDLRSAKRLFDVSVDRDLVSCNSMIDGFVKSGEMALARSVFDGMGTRDVISWNTMISGYGSLGEVEEARRLFDEMPDRNVVSWNSMLAGFVKGGDVDAAFKLFHEMPRRDVVSWNTMLACYAQNGKSNEALGLFDEMRHAGMKPTEVTIVSLFSACAHLGALDRGFQAHAYMVEHKIKFNSIVGTALVDMYCKCGSISHAIETFNSMEYRDVLAWNTIIAGLAMHGHVMEAQRHFKEMKEMGVEPNDITFVALLTAFSHAGMIKEGMDLLACMKITYGIDPKVEHYGCVLDLLARVGHLEQAMELIGTMPMEPNASAWGALLGGCRIHGNVEIGERVGKHLLNLQPHHSGRYVLLSNIYAAGKQWEDAGEVRNLMKAKGVAKVPGVSVIELKGMVHRFVSGDCSHPESTLIYRKLAEIITRLKTAVGYCPDTQLALVDVEDEEKEHALSVHSEKLAIAYGFLHFAPQEGIRIVTNLRVCKDCHDVTKLISMVYGREIILRDRNRFHHFKDGLCSCGDF